MTLPLTAASRRLRGKPGRPHKPEISPARPSVQVASVAPIAPRLLDLHGGALYIGLRERKLRELIVTGVIPRVRIPDSGHGEVRKVLIDREDLDRLVVTWRERPEAAR